jgi:glyoxylase-like metal-dependent hydrolase (beta-lactamase superfamily II)
MYEVHVLVQGYPGRSVCHGGLGWSTVTLLRGEGRSILVDTGGYATRPEIGKQLAALRVSPSDVTDVVLTHTHHDHACNFTLFPEATVWIGEKELEWAVTQKPGFNPLAELHVRELASLDRVQRLKGGQTFLGHFEAIEVPGHTPGHLAYHFSAHPQYLLFTGDAAKNRAELLSQDVAMTLDAEQSARSIETIWRYWRAHPDTVLIPGHDLSMRLDSEGKPEYQGTRRAGIEAWFSETLETTTFFDLTGGSKVGVGYRDA